MLHEQKGQRELLLTVTSCAEAQNLKRAYDGAMRDCQLHRALLLEGSVKRNGGLRQKLLAARRQAADRLYTHGLTCLICKPFGLSDEKRSTVSSANL